MNGLCDSYCRCCIYRARFPIGGEGNGVMCNYLLMTKKRRPCPAGKACTVKKTKRAAKKEQESA